MLSVIRRSAFVGDIVKVSRLSDTGGSQANAGGGAIIGSVAKADGNVLHLHRFLKLTDLPDSVLVPALDVHDYPILSASSMKEVFMTSELVIVNRSSIIDIAFILPVNAIADGRERCIGIRNAYFLRFRLLPNGGLRNHDFLEYTTSVSRPFSNRIFYSINHLTKALCKLMWLNPEREKTTKSSSIFFSGEAFAYLQFKLLGKGTTGISAVTASRNLRETMFWEDASMTSEVRKKTIMTLLFTTKNAITALRRVAGSVVGIGLSKKRPSKKRVRVACSIGTVITSLELPDTAPDVPMNFLKLRYTLEDSSLKIVTSFSRVTCNAVGDITSRTDGMGGVQDKRYEIVTVGQFFLKEGVLKEVVEVSSSGVVHAVNSMDGLSPIELSVQEAHDLIVSFSA
mmetsp:Transcript_18246/g.25952  ORF Transcript_18246/g.25952 Transcript_18246/m.25952 type:complete len:398 (-) Transcript_18246:33-1226(-)